MVSNQQKLCQHWRGKNSHLKKQHIIAHTAAKTCWLCHHSTISLQRQSYK